MVKRFSTGARQIRIKARKPQRLDRFVLIQEAYLSERTHMAKLALLTARTLVHHPRIRLRGTLPRRKAVDIRNGNLITIETRVQGG